MEVKFKYSVGDIVTLAKLPSMMNLNRYVLDSDFKPKEYKIEKCICVIKENNECEILYNLHAYCDEYIQYHNWITDDYLDGTPNEHIENIEFISHDKEVLNIGDDVLCSVFYGDYDNPYLPPNLTFSYLGTILRLECIISKEKKQLKKAIIQEIFPRNSIQDEIVPYIVKNIDEKFAFEYVTACKENRFNPIKKIYQYSKHDKILQYIKIWDKVLEIYSNWNKIRTQKNKKNQEKPIKKKTPKDKIEKLLGSLSEDELNELKKQLENG